MSLPHKPGAAAGTRQGPVSTCKLCNGSIFRAEEWVWRPAATPHDTPGLCHRACVARARGG